MWRRIRDAFRGGHPWERAMQKGQQAFDAGRLEDAAQQFLTAVAEAESCDPPAEQRASALSFLAAVRLRQDAPVEAESAATQAIALWERIHGPDHLHVANLSNTLAEALRGQRRDADAEPHYRRALAIREAQADPDPSALSTALGNLSACYQTLGRAGDA